MVELEREHCANPLLGTSPLGEGKTETGGDRSSKRPSRVDVAVTRHEPYDDQQGYYKIKPGDTIRNYKVSFHNTRLN
jgi:hypothetical protein